MLSKIFILTGVLLIFGCTKVVPHSKTIIGDSDFTPPRIIVEKDTENPYGTVYEELRSAIDADILKGLELVENEIYGPNSNDPRFYNSKKYQGYLPVSYTHLTLPTKA